MKKCLYVFSFVFIGILAFAISGCDDSMEEIVDEVVTTPITEPIIPPELTGIDQGYTFYMSLDHQTPINDVAFSWDGQWLASLGENSVKLWDPQTGQLKETRSIESGDLWIDSVHDDGSVRLTGPDDFLFQRAGHTSPVRTVAGEGPTTNVTGSSDRTIRVWDFLTGELHFAFDLPGQVWAVAVSLDGSILAGGGGFDGIYLWDFNTQQSKGILRADTAQVEGIAFGPGDLPFSPPNTLAVATGLGSGEAIHVWDLRTNILKQTLIADGYTVRKVAISPDGQMIVGGAYYGAAPGVLLWRK
jgi:WD40 repeat protein